MLHEMFYWLFNMSIASAVMGIIVISIRACKKIPRRVAVLLWAVPFLRMCIPWGLNSKYSLMSLISKITAKTVTVYSPFEYFDFSATNFTMAAGSYFPITYKTELLKRVFSVSAAVWAIVFIAIVITLFTLYFISLRELRDATRQEKNIYFSHKVQAPAVYGILRPKIVLPFGYREADLKYIMLHENAHIRRGDNLWRIIAFFVAAIHWFNPLSWVFLKLFLSDLELACDEAVLKGLEEDEIKNYAFSLLECKQGASVFVSAFGGAAIRTRIENILSFKKMTVFSAIGFLLLLLAIFGVLLTNAA